METENRAGRIIGILIIMQMLASGLVNLEMEAPLFDEPGFLVNAASHSQQIGLAVIIGLITGVLWIGVSVTAFPIFFQYTGRMALWFIALTVVVAAATVVENIGVMTMVSASEAYANASVAGREQLQVVQAAISAPRNWAHFIDRIFVGSALFVFYAALFRFALIPRILTGFGLLAAVLMVTALAIPLFGYDIIFPLLAPMGLSQLATAVWLITKGFRVQPNLGTEPGNS